MLQAIFIFAHHSSIKAHDQGQFLSLSAVIALVVSIAQFVDVAEHTSNRASAAFILRIIGIPTALFLAFAGHQLPRRPDVFFRDQKVDAHYTTTSWSRHTWSWARPMLNKATKEGDLDLKDLPQPEHFNRADWLISSWQSFGFKGKLLHSLLWAYKFHFAFQWSATLFKAALGMGPFWTILRLIKILEQRNPDDPPTAELWLLIIYLGLFTLAEQWLEGYTNWFSITLVAFPLRNQLAALVYEKSLRRKNVKASDSKAAEVAEAAAADSAKKDDSKDKDKDKKKDGEDAPPSDESSVLKSRQAIVNLVGVDSRRVSNFAAFQFMIIGSIGKLLMYSVFLINLIGWIPFGVGILAWALVLPVNTYASKLYMRASEKLMKTRDEKLAVVNEALLGIRQIKFSALEVQWEKRILAMREKEIQTIIRVFAGDTILFACWVVSPILLAAASLATYAAIHDELTPSVAFVSIGIFKSLELALGALPELLTGAMDTLVSVKRIDDYLKGPEMKKIVSSGHDVAFENASIAWPVDEETPDEDRFILNNVNLTFPAGELSVISGKTGTGKSLLLAALLGEVDLLEGTIFVPPTATPLERNDAAANPGNWILPGAVAFVAQTPWLESTSFRDNILFGLPYIEERYNKVLEICALKKDLDILTDGDKTELGANGINLSGGQKWRVTLARAIYSRAEILILDDIFSAVDAHVGRQIYEKCLVGELCKGRTRILVTHHVALVKPKTKFLVELGEGSVLNAGLISELEEDGTLQKIQSHEQSEAEIRQDEEAGESSTAVNSEEASVAEAPEGETETTPLQKVPSKDAKAFVQEETREKGMVKRHVYATYLKDSGGWILWTICLAIYVSFEAGNIGRSWWLRIWTGEKDTATHSYNDHGNAYAVSLQHSSMHMPSSPSEPTFNATYKEHSLSYYLWIYVAIAFASSLAGTMRFLWSFLLSLRASRAMFSKILFTVLRTPLRWLDTVPVGRILNRLTSDFDTIDNRLSMSIGMTVWHVLGLLGVCVAAALVSVYILPLAIVLVLFGAVVGKKYMDGARPMKRLESNAKSPVFEIFNASLSGVSTLRAYQKTSVYIERMHVELDKWNIVSVWMWLFNRWMGFRMACIGTLFTTVVGMIVISSPFVDAALAGFTLSFALDFASNILFSIRMYANLELDMNAAERVIEYSELKTESLEGEKPPAAWPTKGSMEVNDLVVAYAEDLPPVLKGISFDVGNNERIGVVGRTGAGKSSLTLALFRFLEPRSGKVFIDGLDISKIDLQSLRSRLAIIPQVSICP